MWRDAVGRRRGDRPFLRVRGGRRRGRGRGRTPSSTASSRDVAGAPARAHGVGHGDAVHLALTNSPAFVAVWLAAIRLGAWIVPVRPDGDRARARRAHRAHAPGGRLLRRGTGRRRTAPPSAAGAGVVVEVDEADCRAGVVVAAGTPGRDDLAAGPARPRRGDVHVSGTTGRPKGVEITQANYAFAGDDDGGRRATSRRDDRQLVVLPLFHANAQYYSFASAICRRARRVALMHTFSASGFLDAGRPPRGDARQPVRRADADDPRPRRSPGPATGAPAAALLVRPEHHRRPVRRRSPTWLGCRPRQLYGMTETIPAVLTDRARRAAVPTRWGRHARLPVDVHGGDGRRRPDEVGEIVVGGDPGITLFAGYLDDPETTARARSATAGSAPATAPTRRRTAGSRFDGRRSRRAQGRRRERLDGRGRAGAVGPSGRARGRRSSAGPTTCATRCRSRSSSPADGVTRRRPTATNCSASWCEERLGRRRSAPRLSRRRRAAPHERRQDPQVPAPAREATRHESPCRE